MIARGIGFRRMVIGLPQGAGNEPALQAAVVLAELLHLELLGTFVADATLLGLAGLPGVRELRSFDEHWHPIDLAQISQDLDSAANLARRRFAESVASCSIKTRFDVIPAADVMASLIRAGDIVAIIEPRHPAERITRQFAGLLDTVFETAAAILAVPNRIARVAGPILAAAAGPEDPSVPVALQIAAALGERLIVATLPGVRLAAEVASNAEQLGVRLDQVAASRAGFGVPALSSASSSTKERLRVVTRRHLPDDVLRLFSMLHGVPMLVIEPDREPAMVRPEQREAR
jgi:hypothetical protein